MGTANSAPFSGQFRAHSLKSLTYKSVMEGRMGLQSTPPLHDFSHFPMNLLKKLQPIAYKYSILFEK